MTVLNIINLQLIRILVLRFQTLVQSILIIHTFLHLWNMNIKSPEAFSQLLKFQIIYINFWHVLICSLKVVNVTFGWTCPDEQQSWDLVKLPTSLLRFLDGMLSWISSFSIKCIHFLYNYPTCYFLFSLVQWCQNVYFIYCHWMHCY